MSKGTCHLHIEAVIRLAPYHQLRSGIIKVPNLHSLISQSYKTPSIDALVNTNLPYLHQAPIQGAKVKKQIQNNWIQLPKPFTLNANDLKIPFINHLCRRKSEQSGQPLKEDQERQLQGGIQLSIMSQASRSHASSSRSSRPRVKRDALDHLDRRASKRQRAEIGPSSRSSPSSPSKVIMAFPNGAIRITRTPGRKNQRNCINLGDLIHKDHLVSACIYAFFISRNDLFRHLPLSDKSNDVPVSLDLFSTDCLTLW